MIGAGIFALTGQIAELAGPAVPAVPVLLWGAHRHRGRSAPIPISKWSNVYVPVGKAASGMILKERPYGPTTIAAGASLLMAAVNGSSTRASSRVPLEPYHA